MKRSVIIAIPQMRDILMAVRTTASPANRLASSSLEFWAKADAYKLVVATLRKVVAGPRAPSSVIPMPGLAVRPTEAVSMRERRGPDIHRPRQGSANLTRSRRVGWGGGGGAVSVVSEDEDDDWSTVIVVVSLPRTCASS